jgi:hypothetical protein
MKLARPDVRHPRLVLAAAGDDAGRVAAPGDDAGLAAALRRRGLHTRWMPWDDPDTLRTDLVILRGGPGDRLDEYLDWTRRVPNLLNAPDVVAWNTDAGYLRDLQHAGVRTGPGVAGATALIFLGGAQSHAFTTAPLSPVDADFELWDVGDATVRAAAEHLAIRTDELLYARADVTGDARLVGLDLVGPWLGWRLLDDTGRDLAQRRFALCVESALDRLGLGPLSHRRP